MRDEALCFASPSSTYHFHLGDPPMIHAVVFVPELDQPDGLDGAISNRFDVAGTGLIIFFSASSFFSFPLLPTTETPHSRADGIST